MRRTDQVWLRRQKLQTGFYPWGIKQLCDILFFLANISLWLWKFFEPVKFFIIALVCSLVNKSPTRSIECSYSQDLSALNKAVRVLMWSYLRCNSQTTDNSISTNNSFRMVVTQLSFFVFAFLYKSTKVWPIFYQVPRPTCWWKWIRELPTKNH